MPICAGSHEFEIDQRQKFLSMAEDLLSTWCEGLLLFQVSKPEDSSRDGGLWSPGDERILGRCGDSVYPFLWYADHYQDERFLEAALKVMNWSLLNVAHPDGSWQNDINEKWQGITVFITTAMALAIFHHGKILNDSTVDAWMERLQLSGQWLSDTINLNFANINYPAANAFAMVLLGKMLNNPKFVDRGKELAHGLLSWFTEHDNFLYGEGRNNKKFPLNISPNGCYPIDLGYNVEESLPSLTLYGLLEKDTKVIDKVVESLQIHLEFMLPDGGWDNSWGTRNYKWTWWGSRTSDGCQPAYALLADRSPAFMEAAYRNTKLLETCTHNGILTSGPDFYHRGLKSSLHHTFCHAKALAIVLDHGVPRYEKGTRDLPCQKEYGSRFFPEINTNLVSYGPWRATITSYDFPYKRWIAGHASGGALSLLWHRDVGLLFSGSMSIYHLVEPGDMQKAKGEFDKTLTPRVEFEKDPPLYSNVFNLFGKSAIENGKYTNTIDLSSKMESSFDSESVAIRSFSKLVNRNLQSPEVGDVECRLIYRFTKKCLEIGVFVKNIPKNGALYYVLPLISTSKEPVFYESSKRVIIQKETYRLMITSDCELEVPKISQTRIFNFVPGLEALEIKAQLKSNLNLRIEVVNSFYKSG